MFLAGRGRDSVLATQPLNFEWFNFIYMAEESDLAYTVFLCRYPKKRLKKILIKWR